MSAWADQAADSAGAPSWTWTFQTTSQEMWGCYGYPFFFFFFRNCSSSEFAYPGCFLRLLNISFVYCVQLLLLFWQKGGRVWGCLFCHGENWKCKHILKHKWNIGHYTKLSTHFRWFKALPVTDHSGIKLEINYKKIAVQFPRFWNFVQCFCIIP